MRRAWMVLVSLGWASCTVGNYAGESRRLTTQDGPGGRFGLLGTRSDSLTAKSPNVRIREYFPETLYWNPELVTDDRGRATVTFPMADSITEWRLTAVANSRSGGLGATTKGIRCFREFFVDIDFPVALTQNDIVQVPVAVYNYLKSPQRVLLEVEREDWFELQGEALQSVELAAGEVRSVHFRIRAKKIGPQRLTVFAKSGEADDAIRRSVEVVPDGKRFEIVLNDRLARRIDRAFEIPREAIEGSVKVFGKCYPGVFAQVIEGVEGMLGMPHG